MTAQPDRMMTRWVPDPDPLQTRLPIPHPPLERRPSNTRQHPGEQRDVGYPRAHFELLPEPTERRI